MNVWLINKDPSDKVEPKPKKKSFSNQPLNILNKDNITRGK